MSNVDGGSPFDNPEIVESTAEAIEKLRSFDDESVDPSVAEFAGLVADRISSDSLVPVGFIMASELVLYDLKAGVNGFTDEPMESNLVGMTADEEAKLQNSIPNLARVAFSGGFADQVESRMRQMGLVPTAESESLDENEIITEPIETIGEAQEKIIADARERIADLDWQHFGIETEEIYKQFKAVSSLCLRNAPYGGLPVNVLLDEPGRERGLLLELPDDHKKHMVGKYWLALPTGTIPPEFATFTRDHLLLKVPEIIAGINHLDTVETIRYLAEGGGPNGGPLNRAALRMRTFMEEHPELLREEQS